MHYKRLIPLGLTIMATALLLLFSAAAMVFVFERYFTLAQQIIGHTVLMLSTALLKIGYVIYLTGNRKRTLALERYEPEATLTGQHLMS